MEELDLTKLRFIRKPSGEYILICEDCGEYKVVEEDLEDYLNDVVDDFNKLIEVAIIAKELEPVLRKLLPINRKSSSSYGAKLSRQCKLFSEIKTLP